MRARATNASRSASRRVNTMCEHAGANVVPDSRSIRARKPLFYANPATHAASNKLFARSSRFTVQRERGRKGKRERYPYRGSVPLYSVLCTICRSRRRKYDQIFAANKAHGGADKYLSDVTDTRTNLHSMHSRFGALEQMKEKKKKKKEKKSRASARLRPPEESTRESKSL